MSIKLISALLAALLCMGTACFAADYKIGMTMLEDAQAFAVSQKVTYTNTAETALDGVVFCVYSNCFRRTSELPYDNASIADAFYAGYVPSGTEITSVTVNGSSAHWAVISANECFIKVFCELAPGESCEIGFVYTLLLSQNRAFLGCDDNDWRLMMFYPAVCRFENGEFVTNPPNRGGEWFYAENSSFELEVALPQMWEAASNGNTDRKYASCRVTADNLNELDLVLSRRFHTVSEDGVTVRGQNRLKIKSLLNESCRYVETLSEMLGSMPSDKLEIVLSETAVSRVMQGLIVLNADDADRLPVYIATQWFMGSNPAVDPFLRSGVAEYAYLLALKQIDGEKAFRKEMDTRLLPHLSMTLPGSLTPDSYLSRFTSRSEYETVVTMRGAAVLNELASVMGEDRLISALRTYSKLNASGEADIQGFVACLDEAAGRPMGEALVAWLYTIDEYSEMQMETYQ